ncbi:hypothetical protein EUGRSUZ_A01842 [Eucalyptus grandis]|uniref:Uncharacterized protein n=2 Tax=Eucalyptus grandis TaxID=71139 RepID=A0ACC3M4J8_EUCGR|nr:hypothetical protein EUGRSUZ_A01842 [Eucalyptus grandis]
MVTTRPPIIIVTVNRHRFSLHHPPHPPRFSLHHPPRFKSLSSLPLQIKTSLKMSAIANLQRNCELLDMHQAAWAKAQNDPQLT